MIIFKKYLNIWHREGRQHARITLPTHIFFQRHWKSILVVVHIVCINSCIPINKEKLTFGLKRNGFSEHSKRRSWRELIKILKPETGFKILFRKRSKRNKYSLDQGFSVKMSGLQQRSYFFYQYLFYVFERSGKKPGQYFCHSDLARLFETVRAKSKFWKLMKWFSCSQK